MLAFYNVLFLSFFFFFADCIFLVVELTMKFMYVNNDIKKEKKFDQYCLYFLFLSSVNDLSLVLERQKDIAKKITDKLDQQHDIYHDAEQGMQKLDGKLHEMIDSLNDGRNECYSVIAQLVCCG